MRRSKFENKIEDLIDQFEDYHYHLNSSIERGQVGYEIVRDQPELEQKRQDLIVSYGSLKKYIKKFSEIHESNYSKAVQAPKIGHRLRSLENVIDDLKLITGKIKNMSRREFADIVYGDKQGENSFWKKSNPIYWVYILINWLQPELEPQLKKKVSSLIVFVLISSILGIVKYLF